MTDTDRINFLQRALSGARFSCRWSYTGPGLRMFSTKNRRAKASLRDAIDTMIQEDDK